MPNLKGPRASKRRVLVSVVYSVILYAAPVWGPIARVENHRKTLGKLQRKLMIRVGSAYRTTSTEALQVVTSSLPIDLLIQETILLHDKIIERTRKDIRSDMVAIWQERWDRLTERAAWTKTLIPNIVRWIQRKHGEIDFHLTQFLTSHGCFVNYLARIGKKENSLCWFCDDNDSPEHTAFICPRWERNRMIVELEIGETVTVDNVIPLMLDRKEYWDTINKYIRTIMQAKEKYENEQESADA